MSTNHDALRKALARTTQLLKDGDTLGASLALSEVEKLFDVLSQPMPEAAAQGCRQRLKAEGKPYLRNSCAACGQFPMRWKQCDAILSESPAAPDATVQADALSQRMPEAAAQEWHDDKPDQWTPEIEAAHPLKTKNYEAYDTAMQMVGNRRSKGALVKLVCWLLQRASPAASDATVQADARRWRVMRECALNPDSPLARRILDAMAALPDNHTGADIDVAIDRAASDFPTNGN